MFYGEWLLTCHTYLGTTAYKKWFQSPENFPIRGLDFGCSFIVISKTVLIWVIVEQLNVYNQTCSVPGDQIQFLHDSKEVFMSDKTRKNIDIQSKSFLRHFLKHSIRPRLRETNRNDRHLTADPRWFHQILVWWKINWVIVHLLGMFSVSLLV